MQVRPGGMGAEDLARADSTKFDAAVGGPIYVEGAKPGDVLAVDILDMQVGDWGLVSNTELHGPAQGQVQGPTGALEDRRWPRPSGGRLSEGGH